MEKTLQAVEVRRQFDNVLRDVERGDNVVVEKNGEPVAAVVPIALYVQWKKRRAAFFEHMRQVSERANLPEDEAQQLIEEAIAAVRAQDQA
ncbi:MAG: type II toxin-antitoxin system prevent-host-death family antitoxin [Chloroflexi bacterium]|nr:type II toxin-antitoxin system prevent-host-death family antitoxin [Chloroflexota bacterium]